MSAAAEQINAAHRRVKTATTDAERNEALRQLAAVVARIKAKS